MPFTGDLSRLSIDEAVLLIMRGGASGRLVLVQGAVGSSLYFQAGAIVEAIHGRAYGVDALADVLAAGSAGQMAFYEGEEIPAPSMHVDETQLTGMQREARVETDTTVPILPDVDEKLTLRLSFADSPSLTPLQWLLLAQIPQRHTLRNLCKGRNPLAVENALSPLLAGGLVQRTGQIMSADATAVRLSVVKGSTRDDEAVELDHGDHCRMARVGNVHGAGARRRTRLHCIGEARIGQEHLDVCACLPPLWRARRTGGRRHSCAVRHGAKDWNVKPPAVWPGACCMTTELSRRSGPEEVLLNKLEDFRGTLGDTYAARGAQVLVHDREPAFHVNSGFRTRLDAYLALDAAGLACRDDLRLHRIPVGAEGHRALLDARNLGENVLRAGVDALPAPGALDRVNMRQAVVPHVQSVERTDDRTVAEAYASPLTELRSSRCYLGSTAGLNACVVGFERGLVCRSLANKNGDLVDSARRKAEQCGDLVARLLATRGAAVRSDRLMDDRQREGVTAREAACAAVGPGEDGADLVDQRVDRDRELLAEETQSNTDQQTQDGGDERCLEDDSHRDLT